MYFKIEKGTPVHNKLKELLTKIQSVRDEAATLAEKYGATENFRKPWCLAGGLGGIKLPQKPDGWKIVDKAHDDVFYPKVSNKKVHAEFQSLPTLDYDELNNIVKFKAPQTITGDGGGMRWVSAAGMIWADPCYLMDIADGAKYKPIAGMTEITSSEYHRLEKRHDAKVNKRKVSK